LADFENMDLIDALKRAMGDVGYSEPTPVQAAAIPAALKGRDIVACAQTGTGKTAAFALPILNRLGKRRRCSSPPHLPRVLVLAPTRELAQQIGRSFKSYGKRLRLKQVVVYGGVKQTEQVAALTRGVHIVIATPGRLIDLMGQGHLELSRLEVFVLDEVDRMLDMGFLPDIKHVVSQLPERRQSLFFSATLPPKILELADILVDDPFRIDVTPEMRSVESIDQKVYIVDRGQKKKLLAELLDSPSVFRAIVFTATRNAANVIHRYLTRAGISSVALHGDKTQNARQRALAAFKNNRAYVLVATDVAARGIDVEEVTHVVNYDMPHDPESYIHRVGRTGRAGKSGQAISFCTPSQLDELLAIETLIKQEIARVHLAEKPTNTNPPSELADARRRKSKRPTKHRGKRRRR